MSRARVKQSYLAAVSLLAVFIIDIFAPHRLGVDILYLCAILLVSEQDARTIIGFTVVACLLILVDEDIFLTRRDTANNYLDWANRLISVFAIVTTALIAVRYQRSKASKLKKQEQYLSDLKAMLFMTSHEVRKPLANMMGLIEILEIGGGDQQKSLTHLRASAVELDDVVRQLNTYLEHTENQNQIGR